jgi:beta-glucosidase
MGGRDFSVTVDVQNTGPVAGTETVQVYAGNLPGVALSAKKSLAGWAKVHLEPGEVKNVSVALSRESLSYWDINASAWVMPTGDVPILVGSSSADIRLTQTLKLDGSSAGQ